MILETEWDSVYSSDFSPRDRICQRQLHVLGSLIPILVAGCSSTVGLFASSGCRLAFAGHI